ncbi:MAG: serine hydrolase [Pseudomonadota bacterium]|nr:serine hydrolase [Pseudomonadota bacterium]
MNKKTIIKSLVPIVCSISLILPLTAEEFPGESWSVKNPDELGIDALKVEKLFDLSFQDDATQSVVLIKDGYIIAERYADGYDKDSIGTSWSMAKSFYASLIGISIERGEIGSLDDRVSDYLDYFNEDRKDITIREVLDMTSGLENPDHEHEIMFFKDDHLSYAKDIKRDKETNTVFEYNNINSLLLGDILLVATGKKADDLLKERVLDPIGTQNYVLWRDAADNVLSYCCIDMSARDYSRFGLLFSRNGAWNDQQIVPYDFVQETYDPRWLSTSDRAGMDRRGYGLHWWFSKNDDEGKIMNASGKFGQYIFIDQANDVIFTRITKYTSTGGSKQDWGPIRDYEISNMGRFLRFFKFLEKIGWYNVERDIVSPVTLEDGESKEFYENYNEIIDAMADLSR